MGYSIQYVYESVFDDARWQEYYTLLGDLKTRYNSPFRSTSWKDLKKRFLSNKENNQYFHHAAVLDDGRMVGWVDIKVHNAHTQNQVIGLSYDIRPDPVPEEVISGMVGWIVEHLDRYKANTIYHMSVQDRYCDISEVWGGKQFSRAQEYVLHREDTDLAKMQSWAESCACDNPSLKIVFHNEVPDRLIEAYAQLNEEAMRDMPEEEESGIPNHFDVEEFLAHERWRKANGMIGYRAVLFDAQDNAIGISEVVANQQSPEVVDQLMTAVTSDCRGRGLAKWLKAAVLLELEQSQLEYKRVITWMRTINEPIQHINQQMGFVAGRTAREYNIPRAGLEKVLRQHIP